MEIKKKNLSLTTEDLKINRGLNVKLKTLNKDVPSIIEIKINLYAIPNKTYEIEDYDLSISKIRKKYNKICREYVCHNSNLLSDKFISDFNFTSANLKKGYNKSVSMSLYVKNKNNLPFNKLKNIFRINLKDYMRELSDEIRNEDFSCYKVSQKKTSDTK